MKFSYSASVIFFGMVLFAQLHGMQDRWAEEFLLQYPFTGNELILHIGCGRGDITQYISRFIPNNSVYGNDAVWAAIQDAKRKYPSEKFQRLSFAIKSSEKIAAQNLYDIVFSCCHLQNFSDATHKDILQKIFASLVSGGKMLAIIPGNDSSGFFAWAQQLSQLEHWAPFFAKFICPGPLYTVQEYQQHLINAGFCQFSVEKIVTQEKFKNFDALYAWIKQSSWHVQHLSKNENQQAFTKELVNLMLEHSSGNKNEENQSRESENGEIELKFSRYEVIATK